MKHILAFTATFVLLFNCAFSQELSKEDKKRIKEELKNYSKDPASYKAKMDDITATLDSNETQIKHLQSDLTNANGKQVELENKIAAYDAQLKKVQEENETLKKFPGGADSSNVVVQSSSNNNTQAPATKGTVYKVQIGMYKELNINKHFDQPRSVTFETVDGMNRYVIGNFADENAALDFASDIKKLGIRDAFAAKYVDGKRVYEWNKNPNPSPKLKGVVDKDQTQSK